MSSASFSNRYGPWAVVTGASDGIGRACALALADRGVQVVLVARREDRLRAVAEAIAARTQLPSQVLALDLAQADGSAALARATADLDIGLLIAAAGFGAAGCLIDQDAEMSANMVDLNCRALMLTAQHFGRRFADQRRGGMVLFSSLFGFQGVPRSANYAATKCYVQGLAEGLYHELRPFNVQVLASAPGPVATGFAERAAMQLNQAASAEAVARATLNALGNGSTVRPGWLAKFLGYSLMPLPRSLRVLILGQVMRGYQKP